MLRRPLLYINVPAMRPGTLGGYALALVSVLAATSLRLAVDPFVIGVPFLTFWPAVIITALISGLGSGLFCVVLSTAAAVFFVIEPHLSFYIEYRTDMADLLLFVSLACFSVITITEMRDAIEREQAERLLRESKERLQLALDTAQLGWWQYDPRRLVASGDVRFKEIFDVTADEMPSEEIRDLVHPDDAERFWARHSAMLDPTGPQRSTDEYRIQGKDGKVRWVRVCWLAYHEGVGHERRVASVVGTVHDITERKEHEEQERLLIGEINHRAKNMLSVMEAIARQTAARNPEHFVDCFSERVQALSANQDLLVKNAWRGVEIEDLVRAQLAPFADLIGTRIVVRGAKLRLNAASAQAVGLALHELTTNAGKFGALSTETGHVDIRWGADGETFTMSWTERGGPPVSAPKQRGFGTMVLEAMAERSVDGKIDLEYATSGVIWRLTCPAPNVLKPGNGVRVSRIRKNRNDRPGLASGRIA
jgi:PAS domain S-box-containing protein